jgi:hypothetical protein
VTFKAADFRPSSSKARTELSVQSAEMAKGAGFARIGGNKPLKSPDKIMNRGERIEKSLRKSAVRSLEEGPAIFKGMAPSFMSEFFERYSTLPQNTGYSALASAVQQLAADMGKTISLASPLTTGLVPYDLVAPSRLIYPVYSPMRNKLPRTQGQGTSRRVKVFTGISGSHTGGVSVGRWSIPEFPAGGDLTSTNWPNQLPSVGSQNAVDVDVPYKFFGITEPLSWLAQFSGQGFEDISALVNLILLQEGMLLEEHQIIQGSSQALAAPGTPTVKCRSAATGETVITGQTTNLYVKVTAVNFYGESVPSSPGNAAISASQVADVTIDPAPGAPSYNIYVATGTSAGTYYLVASGIGGSKYTIQGALPTGGTQPPTVDSGTGSAQDYDGMLNVLDGFTKSTTYPASGYSAGYINQSVGSTLTNDALFDMFAGLWDNSSSLNTSDSGGFRADPAELIVEGLDAKNYAENVLTQASGGQQAYQIRIDQDEIGSIRAGAAISQIQNPITRSMVTIVTHPYLQQGNALALSYNLPQSFSNVSNAWEICNVQDYISISWPVIDVTFRYSLFLYGTLIGIAPQFSGRLGGIQRSGSAAGGNWT